MPANMEKLRIAVTGASGAIGKFVVRELVARGHDVLAVDRRIYPDPSVRFKLTDLRERANVYAMLEGVDAVAHFGETPHVLRGATPEDVWADNTRGSAFLLQMAGEMKLKRVVYASSIQVYGFSFNSAPSPQHRMPNKFPWDESQPVAPNNAYGMGKVAIEQYADMIGRVMGLSVASLRLPMTNGMPADDMFWNRYFHGPGKREDFGALLHSTDAARAVAAAIENPLPGAEIYNLCSDHVLLPYSFAEHLKLNHPGAPPLPGDWPDDRSPMSCEKFKSHFDWRAEYDVRALKALLMA